jgi:hypothetical protein
VTDDLTFPDLLERAGVTSEKEFVASVAVPVLVATGTLAMRVLAGDGPRSTGTIELPGQASVKERLRNDPQLARVYRIRRRDGQPGPLRVGRVADNDIAIDDSSLSRHHASLEARGELVLVVDLESKNGTFLGEDRLDPGTPAAARSTDIVRFGRVSMQIYAPAALYHALKMCL